MEILEKSTQPLKNVKAKSKKTPKIIFDYKSLSRDILNKRTKEGLSFRAIEKATKIPVHIVYSMEEAKRIPSCANLALVLTWLGKTANTYFVTVAKSK